MQCFIFIYTICVFIACWILEVTSFLYVVIILLFHYIQYTTDMSCILYLRISGDWVFSHQRAQSAEVLLSTLLSHLLWRTKEGFRLVQFKISLVQWKGISYFSSISWINERKITLSPLRSDCKIIFWLYPRSLMM